MNIRLLAPRRVARLAAAAMLLAGTLVTAACGDDSTPTTPSPRAEYTQTDLRVGTGAEATNGKRLTVNYAGWLYNPAGQDGKGQLFDTSVSAGRTPFTFTLGTSAVIAGWDRGVLGMRVGGVRRLVIPPELAYGASGSGAIPGNATLVFDIELVDAQ
jgi:FKBP-type peptidyl-prolyl cis-trans isomerase